MSNYIGSIDSTGMAVSDSIMPLLKQHGSSDDEYKDDRARKKSVVTIPSSVLRQTSEKCANKEGLFNVRAFFFLILWYFFSGCTLFLNKYILSYMEADPTILGKSLFSFITGNYNK